jgi:hypothetical protein
MTGRADIRQTRQFAASVAATRVRPDQCAFDFSHVAIVLTDAAWDEATAAAMRWALERFPPRDGWVKHNVDVVQVHQ